MAYTLGTAQRSLALALKEQKRAKMEGHAPHELEWHEQEVQRYAKDVAEMTKAREAI